MTKWLITHSCKGGVKWRLVEFGGKTGAESGGIVDMIAIRKNHKTLEGVRRGDLLDLVIIQIKGGSAASPSSEDIARMRSVANYHRANEVVLVEWKLRERLIVKQLVGSKWKEVAPSEIFGVGTTRNSASFRAAVFHNPPSPA
jgi:hypothetical protein